MSTIGPAEGFSGLKVPLPPGRFARSSFILQQVLAKLTCLGRINHVYAQAAAAPEQWQFLAALLKVLDRKSVV